MFRRTAIPVKRNDLTRHDVDDEALVYDPGRRATHRLNCTARFIWERCDGKRTCDAIAQGLTEVWDVALDEARADVEATIKLMARYQLVELRRGVKE